MATALTPYIFFYGRCEEALEFYKGVFGGGYEMMRVSETPVASQMPPDSGNRVMHASFSADGISFMASDGQGVKPVDPDAGNISLGLSFDDGARGERVFAALAAGGKVGMPIDAAFWGGRFGMVTDKFGSEWMVTLP
ncbi:MAG: PhnB protein [Candidatus Eremiobacteraeota bacterium]|jgi:PhnB protein|nr:PhnB protein [Candidatus Eremiobacteraeota bacterium]